MTADRRRRKTRQQTDWLDDGLDLPEERDADVLDRDEVGGREVDTNGLADEEETIILAWLAVRRTLARRVGRQTPLPASPR